MNTTVNDTDKKEFEYDIALSFAGEDRKYVTDVANELQNNEVKVFYDKYELVKLWGKDLYQHLNDVYKNKSRFCIIFISKSYADKLWANHELRAAQARAFTENKEYILPVRFDNTEIPGLNNTVGYIDANIYSPKSIANLVIDKLKSMNPTSLNPSINLIPDTVYRHQNIVYDTGEESGEATMFENEERHFLAAIKEYKKYPTTDQYRLRTKVDKLIRERNTRLSFEYFETLLKSKPRDQEYGMAIAVSLSIPGSGLEEIKEVLMLTDLLKSPHSRVRYRTALSIESRLKREDIPKASVKQFYKALRTALTLRNESGDVKRAIQQALDAIK